MNPREEPERPSYSPLNLKKKITDSREYPVVRAIFIRHDLRLPWNKAQTLLHIFWVFSKQVFRFTIASNAMHFPEYLYEIITGQSRRSFSRLESIFCQCCFIIEYYPLLAHNIGWKTEFLGTKFWWLKLYSIWWFTRVPENGLNTISLWEK